MFESLKAWQRRTFPIFGNEAQYKMRKKKAPKVKLKVQRQLPDYQRLSDFIVRDAEATEAERQRRETQRRKENELYLRQREMRYKFHSKDFKFLQLKTDTTIGDRMERVLGFDQIQLALCALEVGQVAIMRIERVSSYYRGNQRHEKTYGFRKVVRYDDNTSSWKLRDHRNIYMVGENSNWGTSCFSQDRDDESIEAQLKNMIDHDGDENLQAVEMIIYNVLDQGAEKQALMAIQDECYNESLLKLHRCKVFLDWYGDDRVTEVTQEEMDLVGNLPW